MRRGDVIAIVALLSACQPRPEEPQSAAAALVETSRTALPGVDGRIDHCASDPKGERLFVAALGNSSIEVVDVAKGAVAGRIAKLSEPQGIAFLDATNELAFTTGGDGRLHVHDATTLAAKKSLEVGGDADNVRFDAASGLLYVGCEEGLAVVDAKKWEKVATIALAGHAESFQLDPGGDGAAARIFVNVPDARHVAVVDAKQRKVVATYALGDASANFPLALDPPDVQPRRLYVGCRSPACVLVLDPSDGRRVAKFAIGGDCDDLFLDGARGRLYASCGSGVVSVWAKKGGDEFAPLGDVATAAGARTSLFLPAKSALCVLAPRRGSQPAHAVVYEAR